MKVDAQIVEECRRTISYLKGYSYRKISCKKLIRNQKPTVSNTTDQLYAECGLRLESFNSSNLLVSLFLLSLKAPTLEILTIHFSAAMKSLVFGNLVKPFRLAITFAREVCHLGIKMKKNMIVVFFFLLLGFTL